MELCLISDEISADFETAVELGKAWGVSAFELRGFYDQRVPRFSPYQQELVEETLARYGAKVVAISPGLFKIPYPAGERHRLPVASIDRSFFDARYSELGEAQRHFDELLPASIEYANRLGASTIVCFGFHRGGRAPGPLPEGARRLLDEAAAAAAKAGLQLALEVEDSFWLDTGAAAASALGEIGQPALRINWDPCNALLAGEVPYPDGYAAVHDRIGHVHFKDVLVTPDGWQFVIRGPIDWPGQIRALQADGYSGYIAIETHMRPKVASAQAAVEYIRGLMGRG